MKNRLIIKEGKRKSGSSPCDKAISVETGGLLNSREYAGSLVKNRRCPCCGKGAFSIEVKLSLFAGEVALERVPAVYCASCKALFLVDGGLQHLKNLCEALSRREPASALKGKSVTEGALNALLDAEHCKILLSSREPHAAPSFLHLEITTRCNLRCVMCNSESVKKRDLSLNDFKKIIQGAGGVKIVQFSGLGEPLTNRHAFEMMSYLKERDIDFTVVSNGLLLNRESAACLLNLGPRVVSISLDSHTKGCYETLRRGGSFRRVVRNIRLLTTIRKEQSKNPAEINIMHLLTEQSAESLEEFITYAAELGVDSVTVMNINPGYRKMGMEGLKQTVLGFSRRKSYYQEVARDKGIRLVYNYFRFTRCASPWKELCIAGDGAIYPCCHAASERRWRLPGNFVRDGFKPAWYSDLERHLRFALANGMLPTMCKSCHLSYR